jgi:hypothetical protein
VTPKKILYAQLVNMSSPHLVFAEVRHLLGMIDETLDVSPLERVFRHVCELFRGKYPGYRGCNTHYHDLRHTTDVFMALGRLLHGAHVAGIRFSHEEIMLGLFSALLHDTGYIQKAHDRKGTGGKYTRNHVTRSIRFVGEYFARHGLSETDATRCGTLILCTSINARIGQIDFETPALAMLGKMVATADFLGQIADRIYIEKLLFLFREFREADVTGYDSELELLKNTLGFYGFMQDRLANGLGNVQQYMLQHFRARWRIDSDLYQEAVQQNITYLDRLLKRHQEDYRHNLKRGGVVARLVALESTGETNGPDMIGVRS